MKKPVGIAMLTLALAALPVLSHDFWLIPAAFHVAEGDELVVHGQTGSNFPTTLSAVTVDRIASARLITSTSNDVVENMDVSGNSLRLTHRPSRRGQVIVTAAIHPRSIPESAESFRRYLDLEGAPELLRRYEAEGILPTDSITRRYAKYAKTLVQVGSGGPPAWNERAGHPLEFVPISNPAEVAGGGVLRFRVLFLGEPLALARGHASVAASTESDTAHYETEFETDDRGEFTLEVTGEGIWNVRALHIVPAPSGSGADWDVHWSTFVWSVDG
jgi:uncharacterized GH25 family protein